MMEEDALMEAIIAGRRDNLPRLVYADWLEEHGQWERAEYIRTQCSLSDPNVWPCDPPKSRYCECDRCRLGRRERDLLKRNHRKWLPHLPGPWSVSGCEGGAGVFLSAFGVPNLRCRVDFVNGFPERVHVHPGEWLGQTTCKMCDGSRLATRPLNTARPGSQGHLLDDCRACGGTGRTIAWGPFIVSHLKLLNRVTLIGIDPQPKRGRETMHPSENFEIRKLDRGTWNEAADRPEGVNCVPNDLFMFLPGEGRRQWNFETLDSGRESLSFAAIRWAKWGGHARLLG